MVIWRRKKGTAVCMVVRGKTRLQVFWTRPTNWIKICKSLGHQRENLEMSGLEIATGEDWKNQFVSAGYFLICFQGCFYVHWTAHCMLSPYSEDIHFCTLKFIYRLQCSDNLLCIKIGLTHDSLLIWEWKLWPWHFLGTTQPCLIFFSHNLNSYQ